MGQREVKGRVSKKQPALRAAHGGSPRQGRSCWLAGCEARSAPECRFGPAGGKWSLAEHICPGVTLLYSLVHLLSDIRPGGCQMPHGLPASSVLFPSLSPHPPHTLGPSPLCGCCWLLPCNTFPLPPGKCRHPLELPRATSPCPTPTDLSPE